MYVECHLQLANVRAVLSPTDRPAVLFSLFMSVTMRVAVENHDNDKPAVLLSIYVFYQEGGSRELQ